MGSFQADRAAEFNSGNWDNDLLALTGQASYQWHIGSDELLWSANAAQLLGFSSAEQIATGKEFDGFIELSSGPGRRHALLDESNRTEPGRATNFHFVYLVRPWGDCEEAGIWVEDIGVWYAGEDGLPSSARGIVRRVRELKRPIEGFRTDSRRDPLTGLVNHIALEDAVAETLRMERDGQDPAVLFIVEIGRMDIVNDLYGCAAGDEIMCRCAAILSTMAGEQDIVARYSGAKFAILQRQCENGDGFPVANTILKRLRAGVKRVGFGPVSIQAWIGFTEISGDFTETKEVVAAAHSACNDASHSGVSAIRVFENTPEGRARRYEEAKLASRVIDSVGNGLLQLAFQPIVCAKTRKVAFHEALIRMGVCRESIVGAEKFLMLRESGALKSGCLTILSGVRCATKHAT